MKEQVELNFTIKGEVPVMRDLVDVLNENNLVEILTVTNGSESRKLAGPVFMIVDTKSIPLTRWEYKLEAEPHYANREDLETWLNKLGAEGWGIINQPEDDNGWWFFKRKIN